MHQKLSEYASGYPEMQSDPLATRPFLQHDDANTSHPLLVGLVLLVDSTGDRCAAVVVEVIVELAIAGAELELFEEQRVVVEGESVEDIEFGLCVCVRDNWTFRGIVIN